MHGLIIIVPGIGMGLGCLNDEALKLPVVMVVVVVVVSS